MIHIHNARDIDGNPCTLTIDSAEDETIDATGLTVLPGLIDPHVHFRIPGHAHKETWITGAQAAVQGGYTRVLDMPNNNPAGVTLERLNAKKELIEAQLKEAGIPLRYGLYLGADRKYFEQIPLAQKEIVGVKVFMGASTGDLLMDDESSLHGVFAICAKLGLLVAVHAEDECDIQARKAQFAGRNDVAVHSEIRSPEAAEKAVKLAISLSRLYGTKLYILHTSTKQEIALIREAKKEGLPVYAEVCPHHLFLNTTDYETLGTLGQMNPPLRTSEHQAALWQAIHDGVIDTIGSDHAPHTLAEKAQPYGKSPSGVPGIETTLALLLNAHHEGRLSLQQIVQLTHRRPCEMFGFSENQDVVLVDLKAKRTVQNAVLKTKCGWSPFVGKELTGWPVYTIVNGKVFLVS